MYAEFEVHRSMIRDRVRTEAFQHAIDSVVRSGDTVLDIGAGSGILSVFAARAGAARVYAVEQTSVAVLAQQLAAANGVAEIVRVIHGDVMDIEPPERVDVIVSEWLGGFGIDEGMLVPVIAARDRWLKPGGVMIPRSVTAWAALVHDRYLGETVEFLRDNPYGLDLEDLVEKTVNEISYSGGFRHLAAGDRRSEPSRLWTTNVGMIPLERAQRPHEAETLLPVHHHGTANALALWFSAELAPGISLSVGPGDPPTHWGMTTAPLHRPVELNARHGRPRQGPEPLWLGRPGRGRAGPSRCQAPTGRSTTSSRSGRRSTTERTPTPSASTHCSERSEVPCKSRDQAQTSTGGSARRPRSRPAPTTLPLSSYSRMASSSASRDSYGRPARRRTSPRSANAERVKAVTARRPKTRYAVGYGAKPMIFLHGVLPDRYRITL